MANHSLKRRRSDFQKTGNERWLVSYADFITLLFGFFVVMYSISQVNEEKYRLLSETFGAAFSNREIQRLDGEPIDDATHSLAELNELSELIMADFKGDVLSGDVAISSNENWLEITLSSELLFDSGRADPRSSVESTFLPLAELLQPFNNEIQVIGHTDSVAISNERYANNWELSSARAVTIVNTLINLGVSPGRLSAVGSGEFRPIADNSSDSGRAKNRRVVVRISSHAIAPEKMSTSDMASILGNAPSDDTIDEKLVREKDENVVLPGRDERERDTNQQTRSTETSRTLEALEKTSPIKPITLEGGDLLFTSDPEKLSDRE